VKKNLAGIQMKLDLSLGVQAKMRGELGEFRKSFEEKMVNELDQHREKIEVLHKVLEEKEERVIKNILEKEKIEFELANMKDGEDGKEKLKSQIEENAIKEKEMQAKMEEIIHEKTALSEAKKCVESEVAQLKLDIKAKEKKLQEMVVSEASTSGGYQEGLRKKILKTLNCGSEADIKELATVGPVTALKIIQLRSKHGQFKEVADLKEMGYGFYIKFVKGNHIEI
jgi:DNA uptake protein ComE-like DNA-binding protein